MTNHYHLLVETVDGNLSQGMRQLNGLYTQNFNRRHRLVGHLFQGRYKAILVQKESYLLEVTRYVVLNPLRARMVTSLDDWAWSSHHCTVGYKPTPPWLDPEWLLGQFGTTPDVAIPAYHKFVMEGLGLKSPLKDTVHQLLLGDVAFVCQHQSFLDACVYRDVPRAQRRIVALTLSEYQARARDDTEAMAEAYNSTAYTMLEIADHFGVSARTVSRAVKRWENKSVD